MDFLLKDTPIAFYAPMKPPTHPIPSGDRHMAQLFLSVLSMTGAKPFLVSDFRSWDKNGGHNALHIKRLGTNLAQKLIQYFRKTSPPQLWFTYHVYHKSPDWLGPKISKTFSIPYVIAEPSFAPKQEYGPWKIGHQQAKHAFLSADILLPVLHHDAKSLRTLVADSNRIIVFPPFVDVKENKDVKHQRQHIAQTLNLPLNIPWLLTVGMMREGRKQRCYQILAQALQNITQRPWILLIAGDGPQRPIVESYFHNLNPQRLRWLGTVEHERLHAFYTSADLFVWPAVEETYGMTLLEAQATNTPIIAGYSPGVAEIVSHQSTGLITHPNNPQDFANAISTLLDNPKLRSILAQNALQKVKTHSSLQNAQSRLQQILQQILSH